MPEKREDQRVRLTRTLLQNAFLVLMAEKPVQRITVKELCERAGVNRGTFYLHYRDVYDLLDKMQQSLLKDLDALLEGTQVIGHGAGEDSAALFIRQLLRFFEKNRELCTLLLGENGDRTFVASLIERGREKSVQGYLALYPGASHQKAELFYQFVAAGFIGLLQYSLQHPGFASLKTVAAGSGQIMGAAARFLTETA